MKHLHSRIGSVAAARCVKLLLSLPDEVPVGLLRILERVMSRAGSTDEALEPVRELREIYEEVPEWRTALQRFFLEARDEQLRAVLRGMIEHHLKVPGGLLPGEARGGDRFARLASPARRIGLMGDDPELELLGDAYLALGPERVRSVGRPEAGAENEFLETVDAVELWRGCEDLMSIAANAVAHGVAVSVHWRAIGNANELEMLAELAASVRAPVRVVYPPCRYPPSQRLKALLEADELGEVSSIRVRATVGGRGGARPAEVPDETRYLFHPGFDLLPLMTWLCGPWRSVGAYLNPMTPGNGGQGLVIGRFEHPGRYGILECAYAPDMHVRSSSFPYDLEVEIAGTDGVAWMRGGMAERTQTAPIFVRVGKRAYTIGVESGLQSEWLEVYPVLAGELVDAVNSGAKWPVSRDVSWALLSSALGARELAYASAKTRRLESA